MRLRVMHLRYASPAARLRLVTDWLPRLASAWWCFVDIPDALEVMLPAAGATDFAQWLGACRAAGALEDAQEAEKALALSAELFFGQAAPEFYVEAMVVGSARASRVLSGARTSDRVVAEEVATLYASLLARPSRRQRALEHYATWLESMLPAGSARLEAYPAVASVNLDAEYARLLRPMRTQVNRLASRAALPLTSDREHARTLVGDALLARLGHIQAVRTRGPDLIDLGWEAGLARHLARRAPGNR